MDKVEAGIILSDELQRFRAMSHPELQKYIRSPYVVQRSGASGVLYTIEIEVFWDSPAEPDGDLRVIASIDDGRFPSALTPLTSGFILAPDGRFIGE